MVSTQKTDVLTKGIDATTVRSVDTSVRLAALRKMINQRLITQGIRIKIRQQKLTFLKL